MEQTLQRRARFGEFELDPRAGELHKNGQGTVLQEQQLKVLLMLIAREGEIVTRDDIKKKLWPNDTVVEFDHSINSTIRNLRRALEDNAQNSKYIETVARRGYRLMVPVEWIQAPDSSAKESSAETDAVSSGAKRSGVEGPAVDSDSDPLPKAKLEVGRLTGKVVSHYRVLEVIGGGGMGLVYRAEDLKLGRPVALKFLPEEVGDDPKARERFEREAKAVSALNHPNICAIYEFDEREGHPFIVMELLQGKTLRDHLAGERFRLSNPEGLEVAIQIASGLEAAHEKGIIHRDIKPANIFITERNIAKILDFGVAKILAADTSESHSTKRRLSGAPENLHPGNGSRDGAPENPSSAVILSDEAEQSEGEESKDLFSDRDAGIGVPSASSGQALRLRSSVTGGLTPLRMTNQVGEAAAAPARETTLTLTGTELGTAGYMSPEQIRGEPLDARTDIFSFGLVLYEMAAGQRAFSGETAAVVRDGILNNSPVPVHELNSTLSTKLVATIDKCLEKDREQRYQSAAEVRTALQEVRRVATPASARAARWKIVGLAGLAIFLIAAGTAGVWWSHRPLALRAFQKYSITPLTSTGNVSFADISPDGRYLAYADDEIGQQSIWLQQLATSTVARVLGPVPYYLGRGLRFSPDGDYLYYSQRDTDASTFSLYRLSVMGGAPEKILSNLWATDSTSSDAVAFSPDGKKIVFARYTDKENYLLTANADGSDERRLLALPAKEEMRVFTWSPDGQTIAFGIDEEGINDMNCIAVIPSQGGTERRILRGVEGIHGMAWLPDQSGLAITGLHRLEENARLWVLSYPDGGLRRISNDLVSYYGVSLAHDAGRLATVQKHIDSSLWVATGLNPTQATQLREGAGAKDGIRGLAWLPDGRLVYGSGDILSELWLVDRDGTHRRQLTHTNNNARDVSATAAGPTIVFGGFENLNIWAMGTDGGNPRQLTNGSAPKYNPEVSPDGKWIAYLTVEGPWKMSLAGGESTKLDPNGDYPTISPDGRWIAFVSWDENAKRFKIKIVASDGTGSPRFLPFPSEPQVPESTNMGSLPIRWTADSAAITYVRTQNGVSNIWSQPVDGSAPKQLTNFSSMLIWRHAWSPDGKYLVMARGNFSRDAVMLTDIR